MRADASIQEHALAHGAVPGHCTRNSKDLACLFVFLHWSKEWLEWQLQEVDWQIQLQDDPRYMTIFLVVASINAVFKTLYRGGVWLPAATARDVGEKGLQALRGYAKLANASLQLGQPRYALYPKFHMLLHQFYWLLWRADKTDWVESPLTDGCQVDEGFIGVVARLSRRVSPKQTIDRTIDLYLMTIWKGWQDAA